ncbi:MAG: DUF3847 domain-containing protein [Clostridia bacterium]|nr:DUF3847 domain-containing protein [Clostridia bacterium]
MNKTIEELQNEKADLEKQIDHLTHKNARIENRIRYLTKGDRNRRTHHLCSRMGFIVSGTKTESMPSTPFPQPTGAVPKLWNTGGGRGLRCAMQNLKKRN